MSIDWQTKKLGQICDFVRGPFGGTLKKSIFVDKGFAVYEQSHAIYNQFTDIRYYINENKFNEMKRFELKPGNIVMSCSGTMGKIAIVPEGIKRGVINQALLILKPNEYIWTPFLKYLLESHIFQRKLNDFSKGAAIKNVASVKILKDITIELPNIKEQKQIVAILDEAFEGIAKAKANAEENLNKTRQFFDSYLERVFLNGSKNWESKKMEDVYDVRDGTHDSPEYQKSGHPLITSKNLKNGLLMFDNIQYISTEDYIKINERSKVDKGDVLFAMIGTIGNPVVVEKQPTFAIKNVALFKVPNGQNSYFLKYYLDSKMAINKMKLEAKGATQKFVGLGYLRNFKIILPSFEEQNIIVDKLNEISSAINELADIYENRIIALEELKKSILHKAFFGELLRRAS